MLDKKIVKILSKNDGKLGEDELFELCKVKNRDRFDAALENLNSQRIIDQYINGNVALTGRPLSGTNKIGLITLIISILVGVTTILINLDKIGQSLSRILQH
ncbi:MAG TPA: hypothetical protein VN441_16245 [Syntrophomonas sp.]|nr:hypothetical protein [Syntrophomonas sp.]